MFEAIHAAKQSVYLEMYILKDDMSLDFLNLLTEKAKEGLKVKVILDSFGSSGMDNTTIDLLRNSGGEIFFFNNILHRMHRKTLIIDEERAFVGGVNLSQKYKFWNDLVMEIGDKRLVHHLIKSFAKVYAECDGKDPMILEQNKNLLSTRTYGYIVEHFPHLRKFKLKKLYKEHIGKAREHVVLVTPYFAPKRWLVRALRGAVKRGVKVDVLIPNNTDYFFTDRVNCFYMYKLSDLGINFFVESEMNHAKVMVIDEKEGMVGSNNLDFLSFDLNHEVGIFFTDPPAVAKLIEIVKEWKRGATIFNPKVYKPKILDYIMSPAFRLFSKIF